MIKRYWKLPVTAMVLLCFFALSCFTGFAAPKTGSITVVQKHDKEPVAGGSVQVVKVPASFVKPDPDTEAIEQYIQHNNLSGSVQAVSDSGLASFLELEVGTYYISQISSPNGFYSFASFLVTIPSNHNGNAVYDITVKPKMEKFIPKTPDDTTKPDEPTTPDEPGQPTDKSTTTTTTRTTRTITNTSTVTQKTTYITTGKTTFIPKTGQLKWPIPVLVITGMVMIFAGVRIRKSENDGKEDSNEEEL